MESFEDFKRRIVDMTYEEQVAELQRRKIVEHMDLKTICPHCGSDGKKYDISLPGTKSTQLFCSDCHATWKTDAQSYEHLLNMEVHDGLCIK